MRAVLPLFLALVVPLGLAALVVLPATPDPLSRASLEELLARPVDPSPGNPRPGASAPDPARPFWRALLERAATPGEGGATTLRLGRVLADPTAARGSAESAGELLWLSASGPGGELGLPLWKAILDGPAVEHTETGRTLAIYGCRHSADLAAGPVLEDTYAARLSLARALRRIAASEPGAGPLTIAGEELPVKGGVNFEVQLAGTQQTIEVTFDGRPGPRLRASRPVCPLAPNDARARGNLIAALRALAAREPGAGELVIEGEDEALPDGVNLRLELVGQRFAVIATRGKERLAAHLELPSGPP